MTFNKNYQQHKNLNYMIQNSYYILKNFRLKKKKKKPANNFYG